MSRIQNGQRGDRRRRQRPANRTSTSAGAASAPTLIESLEPRVLLSTASLLDAPTESSPIVVNFKNATSLGSQDVESTWRTDSTGQIIHVGGNGWKKVDLPYNVTKNTVMEFEFKSESQGEIHGIGFTNDIEPNKATTFKVRGSQDWGINLPGYSQNGTTKSYKVNVGEHFTGSFKNLVVANDHDVNNPSGTSWFVNVKIYEAATADPTPTPDPTPEPTPEPEPTPTPTPTTGTNPVSFKGVTSLGEQDVDSTWRIDKTGNILHIGGNGWKKVDLPYKVTRNTVMEFEFKSESQGEIHGIGFGNGSKTDPRTTFNLFGTQNWGIDVPGYSRQGESRTYKINVGEHFTGDFSHLVLANDHDVNNPSATSWFSNVKIYEAGSTSPSPSPTPTPEPTPTPTPGDLPVSTAPPSALRTVVVGSRWELTQAISNAQAGTHILVRPGTYDGNIYITDKHGTASNPIVIRAYDRNNRPIINGGGELIKMSKVSHFQLRDIRLHNGGNNGLSIDDGGIYDNTGSHHILFHNLEIRDAGNMGNEDGIKMSGVRDFVVSNTVISNWGDQGSGIDMVGCHNGVVMNNTLRGDNTSAGTGLQTKGGSTNILITGNRLNSAGNRAIQVGGRTELKYFRPNPHRGYEAKDITVEHNTIVGSRSAITFVNIDGGVTARHNTIYNPSEWIFRILQESNTSGFVPSRNGVITDNIIVWRTGWGAVNVGWGTDAGSFDFARNWWYNEANPSDSNPDLPSREVNGVYGRDPQFVNKSDGDYRIRSGSDAVYYGANALPR